MSLNDESREFRGRTREILLACQEIATHGGREILFAAQSYLQYGPRRAGGSSVDRFFEHTIPKIREREIWDSYGSET